jgi:hypothetical protein
VIYGLHEKALDQPHPSVMVLGPGPGIRPFFVIFAVIIGTIGSVKVSEALADPQRDFSRFWLPALLFCAALHGIVSFFSGVADNFDRARKVWTRRRLWTRRTRDLADIVRVTVSFGGHHPEMDTGTYSTHRLTLTLKNPEEKPFLLAEESDERWTRETAAILAAFLEVPLGDEPEVKKFP